MVTQSKLTWHSDITDRSLHGQLSHTTALTHPDQWVALFLELWLVAEVLLALSNKWINKYKTEKTNNSIKGIRCYVLK